MTLHYNEISKRRDVPLIFPATLVWVLFGTAIPTSPINFMIIYYTVDWKKCCRCEIHNNSLYLVSKITSVPVDLLTGVSTSCSSVGVTKIIDLACSVGATSLYRYNTNLLIKVRYVSVYMILLGLYQAWVWRRECHTQSKISLYASRWISGKNIAALSGTVLGLHTPNIN